MDIKALVSQMTLEEKAGLCSGDDVWHTKAVERLGIPRTMVSDGPHGLRKQDEEADHLGINDSIKAVCYPAASATAASFDPDMLRRMGEALGDSCQHEKVSVILGPAVNIKRSPLCGRNFEYFSDGNGPDQGDPEPQHRHQHQTLCPEQPGAPPDELFFRLR